MSEFRYFDYNATTPMGPVAREAWLAANDTHWANPSSLYREAGFAKHELEQWREELADRIGIEEPERIVFTSGATEANNAVIQHLLTSGKSRLAYSAIEHPCVDAAVKQWGNQSEVREIPINSGSGVIDVKVLRAWINNGELDAVSVMAANNETGVLQPWREIVESCRNAGIPFHTDAAQWIGKKATEAFSSVDWLTGSGHKFEGGKGTGFLVVAEEDLDSFHSAIGGPQEEGRRAGTENLPGIAAMVSALCERSDEELQVVESAQSVYRDGFEANIEKVIGARVIGASGPRLWNTSMVVLPHGKNVKWLTRLSQRGFAVSTGSACSAGRGNPSRVMDAMGLDFEEMGKVLRISGGWETTREDWQALADTLVEIDVELRDQ